MHENWRLEVCELIAARRRNEALAIAQAAVQAGHISANVAVAGMADIAGLSRSEVDRLIEYVEANMNPDDIDAHLELSAAYAASLGDLPCEEKVARCFRHHLKAAELGAGAVVSLAQARLYRTGTIFLDPDPTEAVRWYKRAIDQGSVKAAGELERFERRFNKST